MIKEDFLHYVWKLKKLDFLDLKTTEGKMLQIIDFGSYNTNSGPDFEHARICIEDFMWAGSIEMHVRASDWNLHGHSMDPAYDNVILHVVMEEDVLIRRAGQERIPCLVIRDRISKKALSNYRKLNHHSKKLPCQVFLNHIPEIVKLNATESAAVERLVAKSARISHLLERTRHDWEASFLILVCRYFGSKVNLEAFENLAWSIPYGILAKERDRLQQLESLLFGQAGMLNDHFVDSYPRTLKKLYSMQVRKYGLKAIPKESWKFMRMRPAGFPTVRIAQLSAILHRHPRLFSIVRDFSQADEIRNIFSAEPSAYWIEHYLFDKPSPSRKKKISGRFADLLIINAVAPFLYSYGNMRGDDQLKRRALDLLENTGPEQNRIVLSWKSVGFKVKNALDSQGLIQLRKSFCEQKRCLSCHIGHEIMKA